MKNMKRIKLLLLVALVGMLSTGCLLETVKMNNTGMAINKFTGSFTSLSPGTYFLPSLVYDFYQLSTVLSEKKPELLFKTQEGNDIKQKTTITYYYMDKDLKYVLTTLATSNKDLEELFLLPTVRSTGRVDLGESTTIQYLQTQFRDKKQDTSKERCNKVLDKFSLRIDNFSLGDFEFDAEYHKLINERKQYDQDRETVLKNIESQKQFYESELKKAEGENNQTIAQADGEFKSVRNTVDGEYTQNVEVSKAIRVEGDNQYAWLTAKIQAMTGSGGENLVKLELAKKLKGVKKIVLQQQSKAGNGFDIKTMNVNELLKLVGVGKFAEQDIIHHQQEEKVEKPEQTAPAAQPEPAQKPQPPTKRKR